MRWRVVLAAVALVVLGLGGAVLGYYFYVRHESGDVRGSPTVEFVPTTVAPKPPPPPRPKRPKTPKAPKRRVPTDAERIFWPTFGFDKERVRSVDLALRPPFRRVWMWRGGSLLEFPPAIAYGRLYLTTNSGRMVALNARTGRLAWRHVSGRCVASSPTVVEGTVYQSFLNRPPCNAKPAPQLTGEVVAFAAGFGEIRWRRRIGPTESSPLVVDGRVYVGDWRGDIYALDAKTGKTVWRFHTRGAVKGALALAGGRVYVGSYDGHVYALSARTGRLAWRAAAQPRFGGDLGTFYSTPALAFGRVYIGNTDGKVYSYGATSGKLRWSQSTGGYVYGSPAIWGRLVLVGSYDGNFYAFDAATGDERWRFRANGPISGSATVVRGLVYFATFKRRTYALDARTGKQVWRYGDGKYSPLVADPHRAYLVGYTRMYGLTGRGAVPDVLPRLVKKRAKRPITASCSRPTPTRQASPPRSRPSRASGSSPGSSRTSGTGSRTGRRCARSSAPSATASTSAARTRAHRSRAP